MTVTFADSAEPDLKIPDEWQIHNVSAVIMDSREVQVTVNRRTVKVASVIHYGENGRFIKYVISDNGWFGLFQVHPKYSRLAYAGIEITA